MTQPAVGTSWTDGGFSDTDNRFFARGGLAAALIRDNRGAATNISPYTQGDDGPEYNWSPFAEDGNLRPDLFAWVLDNGVWTPNPNPNQGFYLTGAFEDRGGPERRPNVRHDDAMVLQSIFPFDSDLTQVGMSIQFNAVQMLSPLNRRLRLNLPLSDPNGNPIVELPGQPYVVSRPTSINVPDYQVLLMFARQRQGQFIYTVEGYSLLRLDDIGNFRRDKTASDSPNLGFTVLPDPFLQDIDPTDPASNVLVPVLYSEWIGGQGWTQIGGAPVFVGVAPVATATAATTASLVVEDPVGGGASVTYQTQHNPNGTGWVNITPATTVAGSGETEGETTFTFTGLTAGPDQFQVIATGANGAKTTSQYSNTITVTGS